MPYSSKEKRNENRRNFYLVQRERLKEYRRSLRVRVLELLGNKCVRCGFSDERALQVDHINGGGSKERKRLKNTVKFHQRVLEVGTAEYQLLCANCNWIKRAEENE